MIIEKTIPTGYQKMWWSTKEKVDYLITSEYSVGVYIKYALMRIGFRFVGRRFNPKWTGIIAEDRVSMLRRFLNTLW